MDCIFCSIIKGDIPSKKVFEDEMCYAFYDIAPQAPVHFLVVPKMHIQSVDGICENNSQYVSHIFEVIPKIAKELGNSKVLNSVVLGLAAKHIGFGEDAWLEVLKATVPPKTIDINASAFKAGYES